MELSELYFEPVKHQEDGLYLSRSVMHPQRRRISVVNLLDQEVELEPGERIGMFFVGEIDAIAPFEDEPPKANKEDKLPEGIDLELTPEQIKQLRSLLC